MKLHVLKTVADYERAMERIDNLMAADPSAGSPESDEIGLLALMIEHYESQIVNWPIADPVDSILLAMKRRKLSRKDLVPLIGSEARVSEVLNRKRPLTLAMIRRLRDALHIPADRLIDPISINRGKAS